MSEPTVFDVRGYLLKLLDEGRLGSEGRLPTERELSDTTGASRRLVRRALGSLEAEGLIWRRQGKGTFAGQPTEPVSALAAEITQGSEPIEVMEARLVIEPELAALSASRATPEEVARMWTLAQHTYEVEDDEMTELWDSALHRLIAGCARNRPLQTAFALLDDTRAREDWQGARAKARSGPSLKESHDQHIAIVSAIEAGDVARARAAMHAHLMTRYNALIQALSLPDPSQTRGRDTRQGSHYS